jgi:hypothetical protein
MDVSIVYHICIIYWLYSCFLMIIGNNSHVPWFYWINLGKPENPFSMFLTFRDLNGVQITWNFAGASFSMKQDFGEKEVQQGIHEGQTSMAHAAKFLGQVGPACSPLIAPMPSIFVSLDSSWPKTIYKKGPPVCREREHRRNIETWNRSQRDWRSEGKTLARRYRCDLHPLRWLYLRHHDEEGVVHLRTTGLWQ